MDRHVRNFCIIAHVDHGKSTLADRLLELTGTLEKREMKEQVLDAMDLEREKGITIKSHPVTMEYTARDGQRYRLNLIDTPGHVDFSYEVSRSLAACEGAILVVDAAQGIQAQTLSNFLLAKAGGLAIIPVMNKIDLPGAYPDQVAEELAHLLEVEPETVLRISAKTGMGVADVLERVVATVPPPRGHASGPGRSLIFDSIFDQYRGVVVYVRVVDGVLKAGTKITMMATNTSFEVLEVGVFKPAWTSRPVLHAGDVGYVVANIKNVSEARVGDTITTTDHPATEPLPGYRPMKPMVFSGLYPIATEDYENLKEALGKLELNDAALTWEPETSVALGFGFRCGFLGPLHLEIVKERLEREYDLEIIATVPNVRYEILDTRGEVFYVESPVAMPEPHLIEEISEPFVRVTILLPNEYVGNIMQLTQDRRGIFKEMEYLDTARVRLVYEVPLTEIILDFYDRLKSLSRGYATMDYEYIGYKQSEVVRLDIRLNDEPVDALSVIVHKDKAYEWGRAVASKLKELIPKQMFVIAIQAAVGSKIIARETIGAMRKNVTAKCYGGDISRKRKLLEKQKEGKKRMKQLGTVQVPQEAFLALLKVERN
jgi:GTP-binding protein LepA